jgi:hypothetical protein
MLEYPVIQAAFHWCVNQSWDARLNALSASGSLLTQIVAPRCLGEIYLCNSREGRVGDLSVLCSGYRAYRGNIGTGVVVDTGRTGEISVLVL